jgi:circadian clock protein KaiB
VTAPEMVPNRRPSYKLILFVAGTTARSHRAIRNLHQINISILDGRGDVTIIDIYQQPQLAQQYEVNVAPTLVRASPLPWRRIVGDLSETDRVILSLDLTARSSTLNGKSGG